MKNLDSICEIVHEFRGRTSAMINPSHVIMHPDTYIDVINGCQEFLRPNVKEPSVFMAINIMGATMRVYRSYDVEPNKFIVG